MAHCAYAFCQYEELRRSQGQSYIPAGEVNTTCRTALAAAEGRLWLVLFKHSFSSPAETVNASTNKAFQNLAVKPTRAARGDPGEIFVLLSALA
jgi:hypothetical protein